MGRQPNDPIGMFDSGVGGLTVLEELVRMMPHEAVEYFADSGNCPYGEKSALEITRLTRRTIDYLLAKNCKLLVVACNTITTTIIDELRAQCPIPIVGIEPGTKPAMLSSVNKRIGILATKGTINGALFQRTLEQNSQSASVFNQIGHGLVELIEQDLIDSESLRSKLVQLLMPMIEQQIDTLVLGCTHYNFLKKAILAIFPYPIQIIDTSIPVIRRVEALLGQQQLLADTQPGSLGITTSGDVKLLERILQRLPFSATSTLVLRFFND